jgi:hypothetical protein
MTIASDNDTVHYFHVRHPSGHVEVVENCRAYGFPEAAKTARRLAGWLGISQWSDWAGTVPPAVWVLRADLDSLGIDVNECTVEAVVASGRGENGWLGVFGAKVLRHEPVASY